MEWTNKDRLSCEKRSVETPSIAIAPVPYRSEGKGRIDGTKKLLDSERVRQHLIARVQTPYAVGGLHLIAWSWYLLTDVLTRLLIEKQRKEAETTTTTALMVSASAFLGKRVDSEAGGRGGPRAQK